MLWCEEEASKDWIVASMAEDVRAQKKTFAPSERLELWMSFWWRIEGEEDRQAFYNWAPDAFWATWDASELLTWVYAGKRVPVTTTTLSFRLSCIMRYYRSGEWSPICVKFKIILRVWDENEGKGLRLSYPSIAKVTLSPKWDGYSGGDVFIPVEIVGSKKRQIKDGKPQESGFASFRLCFGDL